MSKQFNLIRLYSFEQEQRYKRNIEVASTVGIYAVNVGWAVLVIYYLAKDKLAARKMKANMVAPTEAIHLTDVVHDVTKKDVDLMAPPGAEETKECTKE